MVVWAGVIVIARVHFVNEPNAAKAHCVNQPTSVNIQLILYFVILGQRVMAIVMTKTTIQIVNMMEVIVVVIMLIHCFAGYVSV